MTQESPFREINIKNFTERARRVISYAGEEAARLQSPLVEPPHIILGLVREGDGLAAKVLSNLGVKLDDLRLSFGADTGKEPIPVTLTPDEFSPRTIRAVELAVAEARRLNHHYLGTEHLLLGVLAEGQVEPKSETATILEDKFGVTLETVREETQRILSAHAPQPSVSVTPFYGRRRGISPEAPDVTNVLFGWETFLNRPSMTEATRKGYVEMLVSLLEETVKEYNNQQGNQQSSSN